MCHRSVDKMASKTRHGKGVLNKLIDLLPIEAHIPGGYRYCGPGTKLEKRLARGDPPINGLDAACKEHDIAYSKTSDTTERNKADLALAERAWERVKAGDSSLGERAAAYAVTNAMKLKAKLGMGCRKKKKLASLPPAGAPKLKAKKKTTKQKQEVGRVIPVPATGQGVKTVLKMIGLPTRSIDPAARKIESTIAGKCKAVRVGKGLYLRPYRSGYGLYLRPWAPDLN